MMTPLPFPLRQQEVSISPPCGSKNIRPGSHHKQKKMPKRCYRCPFVGFFGYIFMLSLCLYDYISHTSDTSLLRRHSFFLGVVEGETIIDAIGIESTTTTFEEESEGESESVPSLMKLEVQEERWPLIFQKEYENYVQKKLKEEMRLMDQRLVEKRNRNFQLQIAEYARNYAEKGPTSVNEGDEKEVLDKARGDHDPNFEEALVNSNDMLILNELTQPRVFTILVNEDLYRKEYGGRLGVGLDQDLIINSFQPGPKGQLSLLKRAGVEMSDKLIAINDKATCNTENDKDNNNGDKKGKALYRPRDIPALIKKTEFPLRLTFLAPNSFIGGNKDVAGGTDISLQLRKIFEEDLKKQIPPTEESLQNTSLERKKGEITVVKTVTTESEKPIHSLIIYDTYDQINILEYTLTPALFGPSHISNSNRYPLILAEPLDACSAPLSSSSSLHLLKQTDSTKRDRDITTDPNLIKKESPYENAIVVAKRGKCPFAYKSHVIASHGGQGLIVVDDIDRGYFSMPGDPQMEKEKLDYARSSMLTRYDGDDLIRRMKELAKAGRVPLARFQSNPEEDLSIQNKEKINGDKSLSLPQKSYVNARGIRIEKDLETEEDDNQAYLNAPPLLKDLGLPHLHFVPSPPNPPFEVYRLNENEEKLEPSPNLQSGSLNQKDLLFNEQAFFSLHQVQQCDLSNEAILSMGNSNSETRNNYDSNMSHDHSERMQRGLILWLFDPEVYNVQRKNLFSYT